MASGEDVVCSACGEPLDPVPADAERRPPCPSCGSSARTFRAELVETVAARDSVGSTRERIQEWIETNWMALTGAAVLTAASYVVGGVVGAAIGALASAVGLKAFTTVRKVERS